MVDVQENESYLGVNVKNGAHDLFGIKYMEDQNCLSRKGESFPPEMREVTKEKMKNVESILNLKYNYG